MRSVLKACDLEDRFPILAVENNCIVSKDADITVAFEVELPELYTVTAAEYEAIHGTWVKAMKVLPNYSVVYKQDWFVKENYRSEGPHANVPVAAVISVPCAAAISFPRKSRTGIRS